MLSYNEKINPGNVYMIECPKAGEKYEVSPATSSDGIYKICLIVDVQTIPDKSMWSNSHLETSYIHFLVENVLESCSEYSFCLRAEKIDEF